MNNKLLHRFWVKALGVSLFTLSAAVGISCFAALSAATDAGYYLEHNLTGSLTVLARWIVSAQGTLLALGAAATVISIALFVFLLCAAGRHADSEQPRTSRLDRFPFDLLLVLVCVFIVLYVRVAAELMSQFPQGLMLLAILLGAGLIVCELLGIMLAMTFAARVKTGTFWRSNIIAIVLRFLLKAARWLAQGIKMLFSLLPVVWKMVVVYIAFGILCCAFLSAAITVGSNGFGMIFLLIAIGGLVLLCLIGSQMQRLKIGAKKLAQGDLQAQIDTNGLWLDFKTHAEYLNSIGEGMSKAVEERLKSERMKTDLITNVSHDLKTPLTSIVSYVDLLKKEELGSTQAVQYVEVLDRQAKKLKKLTEDIVEASKASSGAMNVQLSPTDVREILHQSLTEYAEKLSAAGLTAVVRVEEPLAKIMADGRLLWRVLDNLFSNACKYSLPGSRVYCEAQSSRNGTMIAIKSVSKDSLDIPPDELAERFVRGDEARSSEGSGLGLSIANSLMELQKGKLRLSMDGDLFKAELIFNNVND